MKSISSYISQLGIPLIGLLVIYLVNPFEKGVLMGYLIVVLVYSKKYFLLKSIDSTYFILLLFSIVYALFYMFHMEQGVQWLLFYALFPSAFYLLGRKMVVKDSTPMTLFYILWSLGFIYSITGFLSVGTNLLEEGFVQVGRSIANIWTGKEKLATGMGAYFIFNMCTPGILIAGKRKIPTLLKLVFIGIFIISLLCVFRLGSRTQIVLALMSIIVSLGYLLKNQSLKNNIKLLFAIIVVLVLGINYLSIDLDAEVFSSLGERLQESENAASAGGRTERWSKSMTNIVEKPLGWDVEEFGYSHNMWFDVARNGGTLSFILLVIFTIKSVMNIKKAMRSYSQEILLNATILIYSLATFSQFFVEPVLESLFVLFSLFCLIQGILTEYIILGKKLALNNN